MFVGRDALMFYSAMKLKLIDWLELERDYYCNTGDSLGHYIAYWTICSRKRYACSKRRFTHKPGFSVSYEAASFAIGDHRAIGPTTLKNYNARRQS